MVSGKFFIGDSEADIGTSDFAFDFEIADLQDISKLKSGKSTLITLPPTAKNKKLLKFLHDVNVGKNAALLTGSFEVGGFEIRGVIKEYEITNTDGNIEYKVQIVGDNGAFREVIKDKLLNELDLSDQDHTYTAAHIRTSETVATSGFDFIYPLIDFGKFSGAGYTQVNIEDRVCAFNIKRLVDQIILEAGYSYTSNFLGGTLFDKLYACFPKEWKHKSPYIEDCEFKIRLWNNQTILNETEHTITMKYATGDYFVDSNGDYDTSNYQYEGHYSRQKFTLRVITEAVSPDYQQWFLIKIYDNGTLIKQQRSVYFIPSDGRIETVLETDFITLTASSRVYCTIQSGVIISGHTDFIMYASETYWKNEISSQIISGSTIRISDIFPDDIKQIDFLKDIFTLFHCFVYTDQRQRKLYIEPFDSFYASSAIDWSDKLDESKEINIIPDELSKNLIYKYKEDGSDAEAKYYIKNDNWVNGLGADSVPFTNRNADGDDEVELKIFSPTLMKGGWRIGISSVEIPKLWKEHYDDDTVPEQSFDFEPRLLYYPGIPTVATDAKYFFDGTETANIARAWSVGMAEGEANLYFSDHWTGDGLVSAYYKNYHKNLDFSKRIEAYFNLTNLDVGNFVNCISGKDFRTPIYLDNKGLEGYWYIEKIEKFNPLSKESTLVRLVQVKDKTVTITK